MSTHVVRRGTNVRSLLRQRWARRAGVLVTVLLGGGILIAMAPTSSATESYHDADAYSASDALGEEGYTWSEEEGLFVYTFVDPDDTPKPRLDPNGCGPDWIKKVVDGAGDNPAGFAFKDICDKHDKCYSTYPIPKDHTAAQWRAKCDEDFAKGLNDYCESVVGAKIADKYKLVTKDKKVQWEKTGEIKWDDEAARKHCKFWAKAYAEAVKELGEDSFNKAQAEAKKKAEGKEDEDDVLLVPDTSARLLESAAVAAA
jgi:hypothetical protein